MTRALRIGAFTALALAFCLAVRVDVSRIVWERQDTGFLSVVRVTQLSGLSFSALRTAGVDAVAVPVSTLMSGGAPSLTRLREAGLGVVLVLDRAAPVGLASEGPFAGVWVEGPLAADDPLLRALLADNVPLIQREFMPETLAQAEWAAGFHRLLRADEVPQQQLTVLSRGALLARWERALRERGIRVVILAPIPGQDAQQTLSYYRAVIGDLSGLGYRSGTVSVPPPDPGRVVGILLHLGACALVLLVLLELLPRLPGACLLVFAGLATAAAGLDGTSLAQGDAFLVAVLVPTSAALLLLRRPHAGLKDGVLLLLLFSGFSVVGGLLLSAILAGPVFMLEVAAFRGVKAALLLPPVLGGVFTIRQVGWRGIVPRTARHRVLFGFVAVVGLGAVAYLLVRSGNAPGWVTGAELHTRNLLEKVFTARPRFKEFLVGHPLLLLFGACGGLGMGFLRYRPFLLFFGLVGQVSILNSFAHAHTPFLLSLWRTANGLLLGLVIGCGLYLLLWLVGWGWAWRRRVMRLRANHSTPNISGPEGGPHGP